MCLTRWIKQCCVSNPVQSTSRALSPFVDLTASLVDYLVRKIVLAHKCPASDKYSRTKHSQYKYGANPKMATRKSEHQVA